MASSSANEQLNPIISSSLTFKIAQEPHEFDQIHALNYRTFVEEIPQHAPNSERLLIDRFHDENSYIICLNGQRLVAMVAIRACRPFSLDFKLSDLDTYLPPATSPCEIRLLAVEPDHRKGPVLGGLLATLATYARYHGHNLALISGSSRQLKLYRHLGFIPFGPVVGTYAASFQPMYLRLERFITHTQVLLTRLDGRVSRRGSFLPGPVTVSQEVLSASSSQPTSHRSPEFCEIFDDVRRRLCRLVSSRMVELLVGSGTLANDAVGAQLSLRQQRGLVLSNGEFGNRLIDHAKRFNLDFDVIEKPWGSGFDATEICSALDRQPRPRWLWAVHCETSTGVLNDLATMKTLTSIRGIDLCLDCVSSIGTVPLDLQEVCFATGVSGKALASLPGLAFVFHREPIAPAKSLPRYLDLGLYDGASGPPFTQPSNLIHALLIALRSCDSKRFITTTQMGQWLRQRLRASGLKVVAPDQLAAPAVVSVALPKSANSIEIGAKLEAAGLFIGYRSHYLVARNWIQIALMGQYYSHDLVRLVECLAGLTSVDHLGMDT